MSLADSGVTGERRVDPTPARPPFTERGARCLRCRAIQSSTASMDLSMGVLTSPSKGVVCCQFRMLCGFV